MKLISYLLYKYFKLFFGDASGNKKNSTMFYRNKMVCEYSDWTVVARDDIQRIKFLKTIVLLVIRV
jgi:hypothetical protein